MRYWRAVAAAMILALGLGVALAPAQASTLKTDLQVYVEKVRAIYPEAEVTGRFYDWRSLSQYRSHAGLHLGYDIALNAGRGVPAGWPGRVVDIVPWTDSEYGVCVQTMNGYRVTYGHLHPSVSVGQIIQPGNVVGTVMHDHVDIKVRDMSGGYFDWGMSYGILDGTSPWANGSAGLLPPPPYATGGSGVSVEALLARYRETRTRYETRLVERDRVRDLVTSLSTYIDQESKGLPEAESQMLAWYRAADQKRVTEAQAEAFSLQVKARRTRVNRLIYILEARQARLAEADAALGSAQAAMEADRSALRSANAEAGQLRQADQVAEAAARKRSPGERNDDISRKAELARTRMQSLRDRYQQGAVARNDMDAAVRDYERTHLMELLWAHGDKEAARGLNW